MRGCEGWRSGRPPLPWSVLSGGAGFGIHETRGEPIEVAHRTPEQCRRNREWTRINANIRGDRWGRDIDPRLPSVNRWEAPIQRDFHSRSFASIRGSIELLRLRGTESFVTFVTFCSRTRARLRLRRRRVRYSVGKRIDGHADRIRRLESRSEWAGLWEASYNSTVRR